MAGVLGIGGVFFKPWFAQLARMPSRSSIARLIILDPEGTKIELWQPKPMPA